MDLDNVMFSNIYKNKKILITGNTGFKGSWLTTWLLKLNAKVYGVSLSVPTDPSMFDILDLKNKINFYNLDIRNYNSFNQVFNEIKPDFIFHLAAQAIVSESYNDPLNTLSTNIIGTSNILESLRKYDKKCTAVIITSDKCYDNVEWIWGYRENDNLGGKDIYSGSKGAAELVIKSYFHSFFKDNHNIKIGIGRAGNVIGGGDWAKDRIIVDCINSWVKNKKVQLRSPNSTRPWQHVLEPLSGYLILGMNLDMKSNISGEAFNFGPKSDVNKTVEDLIKDLSLKWGFKRSKDSYEIIDNIPFHEAQLLKLNCDKSYFDLSWEPNLSYLETIEFLSEWYLGYYKNNSNMYNLTLNQISKYEKFAKKTKKNSSF